jgi:hypothetical protein
VCINAARGSYLAVGSGHLNTRLMPFAALLWDARHSSLLVPKPG